MQYSNFSLKFNLHLWMDTADGYFFLKVLQKVKGEAFLFVFFRKARGMFYSASLG